MCVFNNFSSSSPCTTIIACAVQWNHNSLRNNLAISFSACSLLAAAIHRFCSSLSSSGCLSTCGLWLYFNWKLTRVTLHLEWSDCGLGFGLDFGLDFVHMRVFMTKAKQALAVQNPVQSPVHGPVQSPGFALTQSLLCVREMHPNIHVRATISMILYTCSC